MNILLLGSGGREHALAWKIAASPLLTKLWCAPGNAGIAREAECVALDITDHAAVIDFCRRNAVDLVVVGPEAPLAAGHRRRSRGGRHHGVRAVARRRRSSRAPRASPRTLCSELDIPTGAYRRFTDAARRAAYVRAQGAPIVVKADGLAAGKGVVVAETLAEAEAAHRHDVRAARFGAAGAEVVIEEFMEARKSSFFALSDGEHRAAARRRPGPQARLRRRQGPEHRRHGRLFAGAGGDARSARRRSWTDHPADGARA